MKKILFVCTTMGSGGAERNVSILSNEFIKRGYDVSILMLYKKPVFYELNQKVKLYSLSLSKSLKGYLSAIGKIKNQINQINPNEIICISQKLSALFLTILKQKIIIRGTSTRKLKFYEKAIYFFRKRYIKCIICQTHAQGSMYSKFLREKLITVSNPFNFSSFSNENGFESKRFIVVSRLMPKQKGQDLIIKAFSNFNIVHPNYFLEFYGRDQSNGKNLKYLQKIARKYNVENRVKFLGETKNISESINDSVAFICASRKEGMPNAMIESLLIGIPCVTTNWKGVDEIIFDSQNGFISKTRSCKELSYLMAKVVENKNNYIKMSFNAKNYNISRYRLECVIDKWINILEGKYEL